MGDLQLNRQVDGENGTVFRLAGDGEGAVVGEDDLLSDPESEAAALGFGGKVRFKNARLVFGRNSRAIVGDFNGLVQPGKRTRAQPDMTMRWGGLQRIDDQVDERLAELDGVGGDFGQSLAEFQLQQDVAIRGIGLEQVADLQDEIVERQGSELEIGGTRELEKAGDDILEASQFAVDDLETVENGLGQGGLRGAGGEVLFQKLDVNIKGA